MAVKLRLQRVGTTNRPFYRIVAVDALKKRDGAVIEIIGRYQPIVDGEQLEIDEEKALKWLRRGAQPTGTVRDHLKKKGILEKFRSAVS